MHGLVVKTLHPATTVDAAITVSLKPNSESHQVLLNRQNFLQLWETSHDQLHPVGDFPVNGFVQGIARVAMPEGLSDGILVFTSDDTVTLCEWQQDRIVPARGWGPDGASSVQVSMKSAGYESDEEPSPGRIYESGRTRREIYDRWMVS